MPVRSKNDEKYENIPPDGGWGWAVMIATGLYNVR